MKKSEISIIIIIVAISIVIAYFVGLAVLGNTSKTGEKVQYIPKISKDISQPSPSVFYQGAKNPTVQITIGNTSNQQPLSGGH